MTTSEPDNDYETNRAQRTPCIVVADGSASMIGKGNAIHHLNTGLKEFESALKAEEDARAGVQVMVIRIGGNNQVEILSPWRQAMDFQAPKVTAGGEASLGQAVDTALDELESQTMILRDHGIPYTRPWLFIMSDGVSSDDYKPKARRCQQAEQDNQVIVWPIGVGDAPELRILSEFSAFRPAIPIKAANFSAMFVWLSASLCAWSTIKWSTL